MDSQRDHLPEQRLRKERFVCSFFRLLQTARIHEENNRLVAEASLNFVEMTRELLSGQSHLLIEVHGGHLYVEDARLVYSSETSAPVEATVRLFERAHLQGMCFNSGILACSPPEMFRFMRLLNLAEQQETPFDLLNSRIRAERTNAWVEIIPVSEEKLRESSGSRSEKAKIAYADALSSLKQVSRKICDQEVSGIRMAVRSVQEIVDVLIEDEPVVLGMSTIRDYDDYTYTHSLNVSLLSMCLGHRIGLSRGATLQLGICSLFHDLGKVEVALEIVNKPGPLTESEAREIKRHPLYSARQIVKLVAPKDLKHKIILAPFEHHLRFDLSGYPLVHWQKPISLFGRIITIADVYDALTSPRIYRPTAMSPAMAVDYMSRRGGKDFDPILLKVFVNMLGPYPPGTLLQVDTDQLGLVLRLPSNPDDERPVVVLLESDGPGRFKRGRTVDLAERNPGTGEFLRVVGKSFHPSVFGIQAMDHLF